jgi:hypothetical protein
MTTGPEAFLALYVALSPEEQEEAFAKLRQRRLGEQGTAEGALHTPKDSPSLKALLVIETKD